MSSKSPSQINQYLKELHQANKSLSPLLALDYLKVLSKGICQSFSDKEKAISLTTLANLTHFLTGTVGSSIRVDTYFADPLLLEAVVAWSIQKPADEAPYIVLNGFIRGTISGEDNLVKCEHFEKYETVMNIILKNPRIIENIGPRASYKSMLYLTAEFVVLLLMLVNNGIDSSVVVLLIFNRIEMPLVILNSFEQHMLLPKTASHVQFFIDNYSKYYGLLLSNWDMKISHTPPFFAKLISLMRDFNHLHVGRSVLKYSDAELFESLGFTSSPTKYLTRKYTLAEICPVFTLLLRPSTKKLKERVLRQYLLAESVQKRFPMNKMLFAISSLLRSHSQKSSDKMLFFHYDEVLQLMVGKALLYWVASEADNDCDEDINTILSLIKLDLRFVSSLFSNHHSFTSIKTKSLEIGYPEINAIRTAFLKDNQYLTIMNSESLGRFNENLMESVKIFFLNERLNELFAGCVCYYSNPNIYSISKNENLTTSRNNKRIYVALSPSRNFLLYRRLGPSEKVGPDGRLDLSTGTFQLIPIGSIKTVLTDTNQLVTDSETESESNLMKPLVVSKFVTISARNKLTKITLLDADNKQLFKFYCDDPHNTMVWIDCLKLLTSRFDFTAVTPETKSHMEQLFDIRRAAQFSPLNDIYNLSLKSNGNVKTLKLVADKEEVETVESVNAETVGFIEDRDNTAKFGILIQMLEEIHFDNYHNVVKSDFEELLVPKVAGAKRNAYKRKSDMYFGESEFEYSFEELKEVGKDFYYK